MAKAITINTERLGRLTYTQFRNLVREHNGSKAAVARELGVPSSTVRTWSQRLNEARSARS